MELGDVKIDGLFGLSPMAGMADRAFRQICREFGAAYSVTEMASACALCYGDKKSAELLAPAPGEKPFAAQIFGADPETMARGAIRALEISGADILDINMGCPMPKITGNGEGSALMKDLARAEKVIKAVVKAVPVPVSVKFRSGWDKSSICAPEFAKMCEASGAAGLCIHPRTRDQRYSGKADLEVAAEVVRVVKIPVMVSGDIVSGESGLCIIMQTGAAFGLVGRAALGSPWIFDDLRHAQAGRKYRPPTLEQKMEIARRQVTLAAGYKGWRAACLEARKHLTWYVKGLRNAAALRNAAHGVSSEDSLERFIALVLESGGERA